MRYFTGDENGLIKSVVILPPPPPEPRKRQSRQEDKEEKEKKKEEEPKHIINSFGKVDKEASVQKLQWATINKEKVIVIARQNGKIDCMNPDTGNIIKTYIDQEIEKAQMDKPNANRVKFIGLETTEKHLITCNSNGTITMTEWDKSQLSILTVLPVKEQQLEIMRIHPIHQHIMAIGGKDIDLKVFDLNKLINKEENKKESDNKASNNKNSSSHPHQKQNKGIPGLLYEAKNVKNDFLDLQQPIWIHDLQFMNEDGTQIALSTHYYQIRLYDFKKARRPILNVEIGKKPLTSLSIGQDFDHVVFTDTMNDVGFFNIKTGKLAGQLKGKKIFKKSLSKKGNEGKSFWRDDPKEKESEKKGE
ncbi:unnamed protein product [Cunninghamella echinulata]